MTCNSTTTNMAITHHTAMPATSTVGSDASIIYKSGEDMVKFTDISTIEADTISQETEDKFYKKAFETKSL